MQAELLLTNAELVLADRIVENGWLAVCDGKIAEIGEGRAPQPGLDMDGDTVIPGLVELHTDHLEAHFLPRPGVHWHALSSVLAYDAQMAASGITTVFDSLRVGQDSRRDAFNDHLETLADTINEAAAANLLRIEHRTHLRCEVCSHDVIDKMRAFTASRPVHLISLMDHTPGQRQFKDIEKWLLYYRGRGKFTESELQLFVKERVALHTELAAGHHAELISICRELKVPMASHDDTTLAHVEEAIADGAAVAEFPTTLEAATALHKAGIKVMMGAPNVVRGGSHSGNMAAQDLAARGTLDILSSDYVPGSLLMSAFLLPKLVADIDLPKAIRLVSKNPADAALLGDRGEIEVGKRADLVRVYRSAELPVIRMVWREGQRVS